MPLVLASHPASSANYRLHTSPPTLVDPVERTWSILVPRPTSRTDVLKRALSDIAITILLGLMPWRTWIVCNITMVTFRCEYSGLLLYWPVACAFWLILAAVGLQLVANSIEIEYGGASIGWGQVLLLPYRLKSQDALRQARTGSERFTSSAGGNTNKQAPDERDIGIELREMKRSGSVAPGVVSKSAGRRWALSEEEIYRDIYHRPAQRQNTSDSTTSTGALATTGHSDPDSTKDQALPRTSFQGGFAESAPPHTLDVTTLVIRIRMRHVALWGWYEAAIEVLAVGVYLYATIVLSSVLFLSGQQSMLYTVGMLLCLSGVRIISATT